MKKLALLLIIALALATTAAAQDTPPTKKTKSELRRERRTAENARTAFVVDSILLAKSFVFIAERAVTSLTDQPYITLSTLYDLLVTPTELTSRLPFYGNLYYAPSNTGSGPLDFSSTDFTYSQIGVPAGKEKALVVIKAKPKNSSNFFDISIEIFDSSTAVLNIAMQNGSGSMFYGRIEPISQREQKTR